VVVVALSGLWPPLASVAAVGSVLAVRAPQIVTLRRTRGESQVSVSTWALAGLGNAVWCAWGVVSAHPTMVVGAGISVVSSLTIAVMAHGRGGGEDKADEWEDGLI
jgi:hypothetical protein